MKYVSCPHCKREFVLAIKKINVKKTGSHIEEIIELRKGGKTLAEIGDIFKVTRERIRQILKDVPNMNKYNHVGPKYRKGYKRCLTCRKVTKFNNFYKSKNDRFGYSQRCIKCVKKISQKYMKKQDYRRGGKYWEKAKVRALLNYHLKKRNVIKGDCLYKSEDCLGRIEAHHDDYTKPLDVKWFCVKHHREHDKVGFGYIQT